MSDTQEAKLDTSYANFMSRAYAMELEAAERYSQFAEQLDAHNNLEVAALFRKLAQVEALHAKRILIEMRWPTAPKPSEEYPWKGFEGPETAPFESLHYLMQPYHALEIALECELRAQQYFESILAANPPQAVRTAASDMANEEREHVKLIREWMGRVPKPTADWDYDPDPPIMNE